MDALDAYVDDKISLEEMESKVDGLTIWEHKKRVQEGIFIWAVVC